MLQRSRGHRARRPVLHGAGHHPAPRRWEDLTRTEQRAIAVGSVVQVVLAVGAWLDLAWRPAPQVRGRKAVWAAIIAVNFVGPILYAIRGVRHRAPAIP